MNQKMSLLCLGLCICISACSGEFQEDSSVFQRMEACDTKR